ncbi:MAG: hypothetical protein Q9219_004022 [cf. Caloplaca sp. 3 TL-2023]
MDHLICVVDATTFVDHIQDIKRLIYQGHIRLVVPQCTSAPLESKYEKLTEETNKKPLRQVETQRPKSSGKPSKIEPPAMNINPLVAGEFLARLRSQDGQSVAEFQQDNEQYSPWKAMELEEESRKTTDNRPTSFAQAVRKQSMEQFSNTTGAPNGPQKPRLVARPAGADGSPWKKSSKALSLPISKVPEETRPVLNHTILICNDDKTISLAKQVGISTKTVEELKRICDIKDPSAKTRETFGDLEKDFGIPEVSKAPPTLESVKGEEPISQTPTLDQPSKDGMEINSDPEPINKSERSASPAKTSVPLESIGTSSSKKKSTNINKAGDAEILGESSNLDGLKGKVNGLLPMPSIQHPKGSLASVAHDSHTEDIQSGHAPLQPSRPVFSTLAIEKENSIAEWVRNLMDASNNSEPSGRNTPMSAHSSTVEPAAPQTETTKTFKPLTYREAVTGKAGEAVRKAAAPPEKEKSPSPHVSPVRDPSPPKIEDPLDSDEEIVVFNPKAKRLSAQKAQQNRQAQQAQQAPQVIQPQQVSQPPQVPQIPQAPQAPQAQQLQTPKSSPRHGHIRNASGGRPHIRGGHQRQARSGPPPGPPPVIIDPDSFGRALVTNPQPSTARTFSPFGAHGRIMNDRRGNHRSPNSRHAVHNVPSKANGTSTNGTTDAEIHSSAERSSMTNGLAIPEATPANQAPKTDIPSILLKPSPLIEGAPTEPAAAGSTTADNGFQKSQTVPIRAERPRYSPRGSPRRMPVEQEVGYVLKTGQPREAIRGRGKLWVP